MSVMALRGETGTLEAMDPPFLFGSGFG